jgi:hypothetical protein
LRRLGAGPTDPPFDTNPLLDTADTLFPVYVLADASVRYARRDPARATRYREAAQRGGEFSWRTYGRRASFVAGDYVPSVDKEASLFALRAYLALAEAADAAGAARPASMSPSEAGAAAALWEGRASDAALFVDTFHYQVNLPLAMDRPRTAPYSWARDWARDWYEGQTTVGLGFIELGHSGVDTTAAEFVPELLRLYERTKEAALLNQGLIQLFNTKQPLDVSGRKGYFERGFMPELWLFAVQAYR